MKWRGCSFTKDDFLPEESFKSWSNYGRALSETGMRFKNRFLSRSLEETELTEVKSRSKHEMKKSLSWWDLIWFGVGSVIASGIFVLTGLEARDAAGPAIVLSYLVSGISAMLAAFCYTEFAVEIPVAGGSFAYLRVELGDFVAYIAAGNILFEYLIGAAAVARSWTSYFATICNHKPNDFRINVEETLGENYGHLDPIAVVVIIIVCILAVLSMKASSRFNYVATIIHIMVLLFIVVAGLTKADTKNITPFTPYGVRGVFKASTVLFFAYAGFDAVATMAEETKNPDRDIPIGLVGSMLITTAIYCLLALTLVLMQPYDQLDTDAPFSVAFQKVGMNWAKYLVAAGALKGMTTALITMVMGMARYLTHISRTHMVTPWFAQVHEKTGTPINATVFMLIATALIAFFTSLNVLANLVSISILFIFMTVATALLVRRYYVSGVTRPVQRNLLILCLIFIIGSSIATAAYWGVTEGEGKIGYAITGTIWFLATLALCVFVPKAREPRRWGVPLVPWFPAASIALNVFLMGSIAKESFARFGIWSVLLLVYYFLFGLHASYDTEKELADKRMLDATTTNSEQGQSEG